MYWIGARNALLEVLKGGLCAVRYEGEMIDAANLATAERYMAYAHTFQNELGLQGEK